MHEEGVSVRESGEKSHWEGPLTVMTQEWRDQGRPWTSGGVVEDVGSARQTLEDDGTQVDRLRNSIKCYIYLPLQESNLVSCQVIYSRPWRAKEIHRLPQVWVYK